jgi:hypothetical protein
MSHLNGNGAVNGNGNGNGHLIHVPALGRLAPHNIEAEQGVIGSVLLDNDSLTLEEVAALRPGDFFRDTHQIIWSRILELRELGRPIDLVLLADALERTGELKKIGGDDALAAIINGTPHAANAEYYAGVVRGHAKRRELIEAVEETLQDGHSGTFTPEELLGRAGDRIASIGSRHVEDIDPGADGNPWPDDPGPAIWIGLAGEIVKLIEPHTEADPIAILGQLLVCFGNAVGRKAHWRVESTRHYANAFLCVVGNSSKARKGTSLDHVRWIMRQCDPTWEQLHMLSGLSSGEGLIWQVRDAIYCQEKDKKTGLYAPQQVDPGISDKRALFLESEFGSTLQVLGRDGNSLGGIMRQAWDGGNLATATKVNPTRATGAHISVIGHVTCEELHRRMSLTDAANGFANRILWCCAKRSKFLPHGGQVPVGQSTEIVIRIKEAIEFAQLEFEGDCVPICRDHAANTLWEEVYPVLSEPKLGLLGAVTSRAEAQVMRLALIYALLDCSKWIRIHHLQAGLAFWKYCEEGAAYIFGDTLNNPDAEKLLRALIAAGPSGLTRTVIRNTVFGRHRSPAQINKALALLERGGLVAKTVNTATTATITTWKAVYGNR